MTHLLHDDKHDSVNHGCLDGDSLIEIAGGAAIDDGTSQQEETQLQQLADGKVADTDGTTLFCDGEDVTIDALDDACEDDAPRQSRDCPGSQCRRHS